MEMDEKEVRDGGAEVSRRFSNCKASGGVVERMERDGREGRWERKGERGGGGEEVVQRGQVTKHSRWRRRNEVAPHESFEGFAGAARTDDDDEEATIDDRRLLMGNAYMLEMAPHLKISVADAE